MGSKLKLAAAVAAIVALILVARARRDSPPALSAAPEPPPTPQPPQPTAARPLTRAELYEEAKRRAIPGRSRMTKAQLEEALGKEPQQ